MPADLGASQLAELEEAAAAAARAMDHLVGCVRRLRLAAREDPPAAQRPARVEYEGVLHPTLHMGSRFYVVTAAAKDPSLVGLRYLPWADLERLLPTGKLSGSGARLKGCDSLIEAVDYWKVSTSNAAPIVHW